MVDMEVIFNCVYMCVGAEEGVHQSQGACGDQENALKLALQAVVSPHESAAI